MFKSKHITVKELHSDMKTFVLLFVISNIIGIGVMVFDMYVATLIFVVAGVYGVLSILIAIAYHSRLSRETMAKMLGKDFMEFCVCKFCEKQRNG